MSEEKAFNNILFVASGMSPQILTETLYALIHQPDPFIPGEIHMVTTVEGAKRASEGLLNRDSGHFYQFCQDYGLNPAIFNQDRIHIIQDQDGKPLNDIKTLTDNEATADTITTLIQEFTAEPETRLHVSLAGGRKTMSYYTGYALSLYGRRQDQLSHVLVSEGYESCPDFYYPTPVSRMVINRNGERCDASEAEVTLANIPFVRMREDLPDRFLEGKTCFSETVRIMGKADAPLSMVIDVDNRRLELSGCSISISELELALILMFARDLKDSGDEAGFTLPTKNTPSAAIGRPYLRSLCEIKGVDYCQDWSVLEGRLLDQEVNPRTIKSLSHGRMRDTFYSQRRNELMKLFRHELGKKLAEAYLPQRVNDNSGNHQLLLKAEDITIIS
ncbi:CRISPR-associated ring nuclease Csm6 [Endozoicomonas gorgoniicola]|uniref:CRISPR-associated ring nuclease Csm6 n=1 Tax=Endozoicomonas gorgoniicola TaxID=1234144 RepID=A0ABT3MSC9_9GAMM|nr:CRISPR-associated ring nuclease Csm6 [Endozoicomonas gorgoniicola]MCW7552291.1 CRISPR-associated ring nuclease Csm6 [Endozoicomonas gorgoniicola]